jgi:predicted N-formylglutamate amidohydrolase
MNNIALALGMAMQSMQLVQQIHQMLATAAADGNRDLTQDELSQITETYKGVHSQVDEFLASKQASEASTGEVAQEGGKGG